MSSFPPEWANNQELQELQEFRSCRMLRTFTSLWISILPLQRDEEQSGVAGVQELQNAGRSQFCGSRFFHFNVMKNNQELQNAPDTHKSVDLDSSTST